MGCESHGRSKEMQVFDCLINNLNLIDLPIVGRRFTWIKGDGKTKSRLDRFLISPDWALNWPSLIQKGLKRVISDHCTVVLYDKYIDWGPKPFRVIDVWFEYKDFVDFVKKSWAKIHFTGWSMFVLKSKLKKLKDLLRIWNKEKFGAIDTKITDIENRIHELDLQGEASSISSDESSRRVNLWANLWQARSSQHSLLFQKSRSRWLKEGDTNSNFFHKLVSTQRWSNSLQGLRVNGKWIDDVSGVRLGVLNHFTSLFNEQNNSRPILHGKRGLNP
ncbi:hypothetical protein Lal_00013441 [Lupinus albus]|nr:hypothetical protein Lal_00013441 [Lupinus albus]